MATLTYSDEFSLGRSAGSQLPHPRQLAALGAVLCLYQPRRGCELVGWQQATRVIGRIAATAEGTQESMVFFDADDRCCWRLYLLPDTDFFAWEMLFSKLDKKNVTRRCFDAGKGWHRRFIQTLKGPRWKSCLLRLHGCSRPRGEWELAASLAPVSSFGMEMARRIVRTWPESEALA